MSHTVKKVIDFPVPSRGHGVSLTNSLWPGIVKLFPAREGWVSDIPAGDARKPQSFFYSADWLLGTRRTSSSGRALPVFRHQAGSRWCEEDASYTGCRTSWALSSRHCQNSSPKSQQFLDILTVIALYTVQSGWEIGPGSCSYPHSRYL